LIKAMATVAGLTGASRILGFIRDILTAAILGAGPIADAFFVALKLPNFFRRVTAEGAFSVAFVPLYSGLLEKEGEEKSSLFASNAFSVMMVFLVPFTLLAIIAMPIIVDVIAPGFNDDPLRYGLAVELSRITFPYLLLMSLTALLGGVLNAHDKFSPFASAPIFFNLCLIIALLALTPFVETAGHALSYGIAAAGIVQFLWLVYFVRKLKIDVRIKVPEYTANIKKLFKLMGPGVLGAGVVHINLFADMIIASLLAQGSISYLYYADRLNQLPLGMVGIAVGTALLPMLSKSIAANNKEETQHLFNRALEICMLLALPAAVALFVIPETLMRALFERGEFTAADSAVAAKVLMGYAIGLPAYIAVKVFSTAYWSQQDTLSPVKIAIMTTALNISLALLLIGPFGVAGISIATGCVAWFQLGFLYRGLKKNDALQFDARFKAAILKIIFATLVMGGALLAVDNYLHDFTAQSQLTRILGLGGLVILGLIVYATGVITTGAIKIADLKRYLLRKKAE
ncbi:MAG TPA: murein biosynthesis integral membrane protein MurJ, partial [Alphaproteobacteria bacterium]|nr:murein biosynthesis integral membrane protein MurJ [Alphaproteobacteria bacterium]